MGPIDLPGSSQDLFIDWQKDTSKVLGLGLFKFQRLEPQDFSQKIDSQLRKLEDIISESTSEENIAIQVKTINFLSSVAKSNRIAKSPSKNSIDTKINEIVNTLKKTIAENDITVQDLKQLQKLPKEILDKIDVQGILKIKCQTDISQKSENTSLQELFFSKELTQLAKKQGKLEELSEKRRELNLQIYSSVDTVLGAIAITNTIMNLEITQTFSKPGIIDQMKNLINLRNKLNKMGIKLEYRKKQIMPSKFTDTISYTDEAKLITFNRNTIDRLEKACEELKENNQLKFHDFFEPDQNSAESEDQFKSIRKNIGQSSNLILPTGIRDDQIAQFTIYEKKTGVETPSSRDDLDKTNIYFGPDGRWGIEGQNETFDSLDELMKEKKILDQNHQSIKDTGAQGNESAQSTPPQKKGKKIASPEAAQQIDSQDALNQIKRSNLANYQDQHFENNEDRINYLNGALKKMEYVTLETGKKTIDNQDYQTFTSYSLKEGKIVEKVILFDSKGNWKFEGNPTQNQFFDLAIGARLAMSAKTTSKAGTKLTNDPFGKLKEKLEENKENLDVWTLQVGLQRIQNLEQKLTKLKEEKEPSLVEALNEFYRTIATIDTNNIKPKIALKVLTKLGIINSYFALGNNTSKEIAQYLNRELRDIKGIVKQN